MEHELSVPAPWDQLPDIELYMDQLLTYVNRQEPFEQPLTKSMVNNYIKQGIISRPHGKRYTREHITSLYILGMLKEVLPLPLCGRLFEELELNEKPREVYELFRSVLASVLVNHEQATEGPESLRFALLAYIARRAAIDRLSGLNK